MRNLFVLVSLSIIWIILVESFNPVFVISGVAISIISMRISQRYLPLKKIEDVSFAKLIFYPFMLLGQIYVGGIYVIKIILSGQRSDVVTIKTHLKNETLRVIMADTITLTPGSILLDLEEDNITVVWLRPAGDPDPELVENKDEILKGSLEKTLLKAEK